VKKHLKGTHSHKSFLYAIHKQEYLELIDRQVCPEQTRGAVLFVFVHELPPSEPLLLLDPYHFLFFVFRNQGKHSHICQRS
jgi:hypothetical protein